MGMMTEFKEFAMRGNVIDLAVGVVIGGAFGKIVSSLVDNLIMPFVGLLTGGIDFSKWAIVLRAASTEVTADGIVEVPALTLGIGAFVNAIIQFIIVAFAIFMVIKAINRVHRKPEAAPAEPPEEVVLLREIRDSLKK